MTVELRTTTCETCWGEIIVDGDVCEKCHGTGYETYSILCIQHDDNPMRQQVIFLKDEVS